MDGEISKPTAGIGPFNPKAGLILTEHVNGGWTISEGRNRTGDMPSVVGAYSNASDMLEALNSALAE